MSDIAAILRWYAVLSVIAAGLLPLITWLGAGLGPLRVGIVRPLSLVILTAVVWWPAAMIGLPFSTPTVVAGIAILATASWVGWWRAGRPSLDLRWLVLSELTWLALFVAYVWFRGFNADIAYTEKPMEIALLTSISRSTSVPAPDAWLAGYAINYYYFGYQMISSVVRLSGVPAAIGFNLALATLFASVGTATMAISGQIVRLARGSRLAIGVAAALGPLLVLFAGNLETARRLLVDWRATIDAGWWQGVGWQASRIIVDHNVFQLGDSRETINEFPAFSFVLGDLHPHVLTLPLLASILALALGLLASGVGVDHRRIAGIGAVVGLLYASNSWDAPTGLALILLTLALALRGRLREWLSTATIAAVAAAVAALPFVISYSAPVGVPNDAIPVWLGRIPVVRTIFNTFGIVTWRPSSARELILVHGAWIVVFAMFAGVVIWRERRLLASLAPYRIWLLGAGLLALGIAVAWAPAVIVLGLPLAVSVRIAWQSRDAATQALAALFAFGFALALTPELVYIQDVFGDRMNTVFKLYFQAWLVLATASAAAVVLVVVRAPRFSRPAMAVILTALVIATLPYAPLSADDWAGGFHARRGLDGEKYLDAAGGGDLAAIKWLRDNARDGDTIVEAPGCSYGVLDGVPLSRMSAFSGIPTVVGWVGHESQWRRGEIADLGTFLDARVGIANALLDGRPVDTRHPPRFLIIGRQETRGNSVCAIIATPQPDVEQRLADIGWVIVFEAAETRVYARSDHPLAPSDH